MDANGNTLVELGIELMKNLLVLFNLILLPLFGYGQNKYYGTFTGDLSGGTNLQATNVVNLTNKSAAVSMVGEDSTGHLTTNAVPSGGGTVYATNIVGAIPQAPTVTIANNNPATNLVMVTDASGNRWWSNAIPGRVSVPATNLVGTVPAANLPTLPYAALTKTNQADYYSGNSTGVSITNFNNLTVNNFTGSLMNGTLTNNLAGTYSISAYATIADGNGSNPIYYLGVFTNGVLAGYADEDLSEYSTPAQSNLKLNIGTQLFQLPAGTGIQLKVWQAVNAPETYDFLFVNLSVQAH